MSEINGQLISYNPKNDEILGDYFGDVLEDNPELGFAETTSYNYIPDSYYQKWEEGWIESVRDFWNEIEDKI